MVKLCVDSPPVKMEGLIEITAKVAIVTKAKLDAISVNGSCSCDDLPPPPPALPVVDVMCVVDGSDSFNIKVANNGVTTGANAFEATLESMQEYLMPQLQSALGNARLTYSVIQFSGIKQLEGKYKPGSSGETGTPGLKHWNVEYGPSTSIPDSSIKDIVSLDGNGQFYLLLQDLALGNLDNHMARARSTESGQKRRKVVIAIMDEEWDCNRLNDQSGRNTNPERICDLAHRNGLDIFSIIVRPNRMKNLNEDFISNKLCRDSSRYMKVYTDQFGSEMKSAMDNVISQIRKMK